MLAMKKRLLTLAAVLFLGVAARGATITLSDDTVIDSTFPREDNYLVVTGQHPPTIVSIVDGAILNGNEDSPLFDVFDSSIVKLFGGYLDSFPLPELRAHNSARIEVHGGDLFQATFELLDNSSLHLSGDTGLFVAGYGNSVLRVDGGQSFAARMREHSRIVQANGSADEVLLYDNSFFEMHGGFVNFGFQAHGASRTLISGGDIVLAAQLFDQAVVEIRGGKIGQDVYVNDDALLHVYGLGLDFVFDEDRGHQVKGLLADGSEIEFNYRFDDQDQIILHEVPEPATSGMLAVGLSVIVTARWGRRN